MNKYRWMISVLVLTLGIIQIPGTAQCTDISQITTEKAREAFSKENFDLVIEILDDQVDMESSTSDDSEYLYMLGYSIFRKYASDIKACRIRGELGPGSLNDYHVPPMKRASALLLKAQEVNPGFEKAAECLHTAAVIFGYGCLNHFDESKATYQKIIDNYPDTIWAQDAEKMIPKYSAHGHK